VAHFLAKIARREARPQANMSREALDRLCVHAWPGNVRELENAVERAVAVAKGNVILPSDLPVDVHGGGEVESGTLIDDRPTLAELERRYIRLVLGECGGNKKKAAERLGIDRRTLYRALERTGEDAGAEEEAPADDS
jgi:DNA-binding NtrC family response regulator